MDTQVNEVSINGVEYVRKDTVQENSPAVKVDGLERCIIRSYGAGVFFGYVKEKKSEVNGVNVTLLKSKRVFQWAGACSLTQLAMEGTKDSGSCRITEAIDEQFIANVIEMLPMTKKSEDSLDGVKVWKK